MNIRKLGIIGGFAVGAALALAPAAVAAPPAPSTDAFAIDFGDIRAAEISSMNFLFGIETTLAGVNSHVVHNEGAFDTIPAEYAPKTGDMTPLNYLLYGIDPEKAGPSSDPGAYNIFNGATTQFTDANNVLLYALLNDGEQIDPTKVDVNDFLIGSSDNIAHGLSGDSVFEDFGNFFGAGVNDMLGYFALPSIDF